MTKDIIRNKIIVIIALAILCLCSVYANNDTNNKYTSNYCNQEEIIERINSYTDSRVKQTIDDSFNEKWKNHFPEFIEVIETAKETFNFGLKVFAVAIFGSILCSLLVYQLIKHLINKRKKKYGN